MQLERLVTTVISSPVGALTLVGDDLALHGIYFDAHGGSARTGSDHSVEWEHVADDGPVLTATATQLAEYFAGTREKFDLPLAPRGTPFQQRVWTALRAIAYGQTSTYGDVARRLGLAPSASRAVGLANGANPISIVVPCHRVIGADGTLTGYGGGLARKQFLLDLERDQLF
jgi:methylated-DNA-[protein]-cysteine S-methyltransferase